MNWHVQRVTDRSMQLGQTELKGRARRHVHEACQGAGQEKEPGLMKAGGK